jgi:biopolymer transport protein ExbD
MAVRRRPFLRRRQSLTSLIDVIFLLLMFFMLSSTFARHGELPFAAAAAGTPAPSDAPPAFLRLSSEALTLNGDAVALTDIPTRLTDLAGGTPPQVIVALSGEVSSQRLVDVLAQVSTLPDATVTVID